MANQYSKYQLQPYVSQYVDPQRVQIATTLRDRWDRNKMQHDLLQRTAASMSVLDGDKHHKTSAIDDLNSTFEDTITANNFENAGAVVSNAVTDFQGNEALIASRQSYVNWEKDQAVKMQLRAQGQNVLFDKVYKRDEQGQIMYDENNQPVTMDAGQAHSSYSVDPQTGEVSTSVYSGSVQGQLNYSGKMEEMLQGIEADPVYLQKYGLQPSDIQGYMMHGSEVGEAKVEKIVNALQGAYLDTNEGVQQMKKLTEMDINSNTGQNFTQEEALESINQQMQAIGSKQIGRNLQYMKNEFFFDAMKNSETKSIWQPNTVQRDVTKNGKQYTAVDLLGDSSGLLKDKFFNENGQYLYKNTPALNDQTIDDSNIEDVLGTISENLSAEIDAAGGDIGLIEEAKIKANKDAYIAKMLVDNKDTRFSRNENGDLNFKSDKEFLQSLANAQKEYDSWSSTMSVPTLAHSKYMTEAITKGDFNGVPWYVRNDKGQITKGREEAIEELAKMHRHSGGSGVSQKKTVSAINNAIANGHLSMNGYSSSGYGAGSRYVTVNVPAGTGTSAQRAFTVQVEIGGDEKSEAMFKNSHQIVTQMRNHKYSQTTDVSLGMTKLPGEEGQFEQIATYSFEFNPKTKIIEPVMNINFHKIEGNGVSKDIYKSVGPSHNNVSEENMSKWRGFSILDDLMNAEMSSYMNSGDPFSYISANTLSSSGQK